MGCSQSQAAIRRMAMPAPQDDKRFGPAKAPKRSQRIILPPSSRWGRFCSWLARWWAPPQRDANGKWLWFYRTRMLGIWWLRAIGRSPSFIWTLLGGRLPVVEAIERDKICDDCPRLVRQIVKRKGAWAYKRYCGGCGCPRWMFAELSFKNRLRRHDCPDGRHPGSAAWRELMEDDWEENTPSGDRSFASGATQADALERMDEIRGA